MFSRAFAIPVSACFALGLMTAAFSESVSASSVLEGAYTEEQALRGQEHYYTYCLACHGDDMAGRDRAPPLAGPQFSDVWEAESLWALVDRIGTMPPDRPDVLARKDAVELLTYILWFNGLPIGNDALGTEKSVLEGVVFETPAPDQ